MKHTKFDVLFSESGWVCLSLEWCCVLVCQELSQKDSSCSSCSSKSQKKITHSQKDHLFSFCLICVILSGLQRLLTGECSFDEIALSSKSLGGGGDPDSIRFFQFLQLIYFVDPGSICSKREREKKIIQNVCFFLPSNSYKNNIKKTCVQ